MSKRTVLITIPGDVKREFSNKLHQKINDGLKLVIIQRPKRQSPLGSLVRLYKRAGRRILLELWYGLLLRIDRRVTSALSYFRHSSYQDKTGFHTAPVLEVDSVNSDEVHRILQELKPDLLVVWGSTILKPHIVSTAKRAINLHFGYCPYYRGALANQYAALRGDFAKIGATIHYVNGKPDAGDILRVVEADHKMPPQAMFLDLNDRAVESFLEISAALHEGHDLPAEPQDISQSQNFLLRSWTPSLRYELGRRILAREASHRSTFNI